MFEDEPSERDGKWEQVVNAEDDYNETENASFKDESYILDYRVPANLSGSTILCTIFTALPPICTIVSFMFKLPALLYLCPAFVLSSWSLMRNGADKSQLITSVTCMGMSMFSHYMAMQRETAAKAAREIDAAST